LFVVKQNTLLVHLRF